MSLSAISTSASSALPTVNFHPHGHRKGGHASGAAESGNGSTIGQLPVGASTSLFGNVVQSLEQAVGVQNSASTSAAAATGTSAGATATSAGTTATTSSASSTAASNQSPSAALQNFLNSLLHSLQTNEAQAAGGAGNTISAKV